MKNILALFGYPFLILSLIVLAVSSLFIALYFVLEFITEELFNLKINLKWTPKS